MLELLRHRFNVVVVDMPVPPPPQMFNCLVAARQVVIVFGPDIASLRDVKALRNLINISTGSDRVITVLNRSDTVGGLSNQLIESGLGAKPDITIPDLGKKMLQALNIGVPARKRVPALRRYLAPLVREVAGVRMSVPRWSWLGMKRRT